LRVEGARRLQCSGDVEVGREKARPYAHDSLEYHLNKGLGLRVEGVAVGFRVQR